MRKQLRRVQFMILLVIAMCAIGCSGEKGISRGVVERALSGDAGTEAEVEEVKATGEVAIPVIFETLRADAADERSSYMAESIVFGMLRQGTADATAPHLRKVLMNTQEVSELRVHAARMLAWYPESQELKHALMVCAREDSHDELRAACIGSAVVMTVGSLLHRKSDWSIEPELQQLLTNALRDQSSLVRLQACDSVGNIAVKAIDMQNPDIEWCRKLLIEARGDEAYEIRKVAVEALSLIEELEDRRKN